MKRTAPQRLVFRHSCKFDLLLADAQEFDGEHQVFALESETDPTHGQADNCDIRARCRNRSSPLALAVSLMGQTDQLNIDDTVTLRAQARGCISGPDHVRKWSSRRSAYCSSLGVVTLPTFHSGGTLVEIADRNEGRWWRSIPAQAV
jgi:hypothetical protein